MNKLTILLFSILISFNSYGWFFGLFDNPICIETDGQTRGEIVYLPNEDDAFTGKSLCVYKNGKNKSESNYKDGKKDGLLTLWYENGNKKSEINFVNGERHGTRTDWYDDIRRELGQIKSTAIYKAGKQHGSQVAWHPNGKKMAETIFVNDKEDGAFIAWHDNGELKLSSYFKDGKEDGKFSLYDELSNKLVEGQYIDGEKDGTWKEWIIKPGYRYSSESTTYPKTTVTYINGLKNGLETNYLDGGLYDCSYGAKQSEGYYKNGKKDGPWKYWDEVGRERWYRSDGRLDWTCSDRSNRSTETEGMYKNGMKSGEWREGDLIGSYVNGKKHNIWTEYDIVSTGYIGDIIATYSYNFGIKDGLFETFNHYGKNEKLTEERYKNGKKDGVWTTWFEMEYCFSSCEADIQAGKNIALTQEAYSSYVYQKKSETNYKNGEKNGVEIEWGMRDDLSGYKIHQTNYKNGRKDGLYIKYFTNNDDNNKEIKGYYQAGEKHGVWLEYHWDGELSRAQRY